VAKDLHHDALVYTLREEQGRGRVSSVVYARVLATRQSWR
jgi:hypothetical protein